MHQGDKYDYSAPYLTSVSGKALSDVSVSVVGFQEVRLHGIMFSVLSSDNRLSTAVYAFSGNPGELSFQVCLNWTEFWNQ